jgi:hypothetical protein
MLLGVEDRGIVRRLEEEKRGIEGLVEPKEGWWRGWLAFSDNDFCFCIWALLGSLIIDRDRYMLTKGKKGKKEAIAQK